MLQNILQPVHQSPTDLRLIVSPVALNYAFSVLCAVTVPLDESWSVTFQIVGESHTATLRYAGEVVLQEVFACVPLMETGNAHQQHFDTLVAYDYTQEYYRVHVHFEHVQSEHVQIERMPFTPDSSSQPNETDPNTSTLSFAFPSVWGHTPITRIQWQQETHALRWWTLHTYPQPTGAIYVTTASQLYFKELALCLLNNF
ncbi:MAG: hypothetical protein OHK0046_02080 [Anaerolineae bacterium]